MYLLGSFPGQRDKVRDRLWKNLRGEISMETEVDGEDF
jgi:hypothetical protein